MELLLFSFADVILALINKPIREVNIVVTISDIAGRMQLSTATVSNALTGKGRISEQRRSEILDVAREMGYDFTRIRGSAPKQKSICVIEEQAGITFCDRILQGICTAADKYNAQVTIYNLNILTMTDWSSMPPPKMLQETLRKTCGWLNSSYMGMIYISQYPRDMTSLLPRLPYPVICAYAYTNDGIPCINYDDQQGALLATSHLAKLGRKRIAMISGVVDSIPMTKRFAGYQRALVQAGLSFSPEYVCIGSWNESSGYDAMKQLLALPERPDAVFCQSDYLAIGAIRAVKEAGFRVPEDIAIVGFDDIDAASVVDPKLTTIAPPHVEIGMEAVHKLFSIVNKTDDGNANVKLNCWLLQRGTA